MGCDELIESLRKSAAERVRAIWTEAEGQAEEVKADILHKIELMRGEYAGKLAGSIEEETSRILLEAHSKARMIRLSAESFISKRLFSRALTLLTRLRDEGSENLFGRFARELPPLRWEILKVHPGDVDIARKYFPKAVVVPDSNIAGGLEATAEAGRVRVVNTFEKRLERAWVDLLPDLMRDVQKVVSDGGTFTGR